MIFTNRTDYSLPAARERLAKTLSRLIDVNGAAEVPYKPNRRDDMFWTLDGGNDWKLKFFADQPDRFEIRYRYQCAANQYEQALAPWLKIRIMAEPVDVQPAPQALAMKAALKAIYDLTEGFADGAPDASALDHLANEVSALASPWGRVG